MADNGWVLVDDRDPGIAYYAPPGAVIWQGGVSQEYMQTTTGLDPGDTLTYYFNASSIAIFGTYGPTGASGPPIALYQVDNTTTTTVTAPITQATLYRQNFWTSDSQLPSLAPGTFHKLAVTATATNDTVWIDYLAYPPNSIATPSSTSGTSTSSSTFSTLTVTPTTNVGSQTPSPAGTSNSNTNVGALVAGVVVGTVALILAAVALVIYMRRRRPRVTAREYLMPSEINTSPDMSQNHPTLLSPTVTPLPLSEDTPCYSSVPQQESPRGDLPRPLPQIPTRTSDGGVRLMGGPLELPPEYQEHY